VASYKLPLEIVVAPVLTGRRRGVTNRNRLSSTAAARNRRVLGELARSWTRLLWVGLVSGASL
jgi:hypothetical protein